MVTINVYLDNGNVSQNVRKAIKAQTVAALFADFEPTPRGYLVKQIAMTENGEPIYAKVGLTIAIGEDVFAPKAEKTAHSVEIPDLFD